jgi:hypothetical protein
VQGEIRTPGQIAVHRDEFLHAADLATQYDAFAWQADLDRPLGRIQRRADQRLAQH